MGWIRTLWRIIRDKTKVQALDFIFEIAWTIFSIATVLLLWGTVLTKMPTGWSEKMVLAFALFIELYYVVRGYIRDVVWMYGEYYVEGRFEPFLKPRPFLYGILVEQ